MKAWYYNLGHAWTKTGTQHYIRIWEIETEEDRILSDFPRVTFTKKIVDNYTEAPIEAGQSMKPDRNLIYKDPNGIKRLVIDYIFWRLAKYPNDSIGF